MSTVTVLTAETAEREWDLTGVMATLPDVDFSIFRLNSAETQFSFDPSTATPQISQSNRFMNFHSDLLVYLPYNYSQTHRLIRRSGDAGEYTDFIDTQWEAVTDFLEHILDHSPILINPPHAARLAANKMVVLKAAYRHGISIPQTLFSNSASHVLRVFDQDPIVGKLLGYHIHLADGRIIPTSLITRSDLMDDASVDAAPSCFQSLHYTPVQLRTYVFNSIAKSVELIAPSLSHDRLDIRLHNNVDMNLRIVSDFHDYEQSLVRLCNELNIYYAAIDSLVEDGQPIFLDLNPHGTWMWLPDDIKTTITAEFANMLSALLDKTK